MLFACRRDRDAMVFQHRAVRANREESRGCGSVGRASPCQGEGRGFESRHPLRGAGSAQPQHSHGGLAERLGTGLQSRLHRFESGTHLGRLAQRERASLTRKRSLVRSQYRPPDGLGACRSGPLSQIWTPGPTSDSRRCPPGSPWRWLGSWWCSISGPLPAGAPSGRLLHEGGVPLADIRGYSTKVRGSCSTDNPWPVQPHLRAVRAERHQADQTRPFGDATKRAPFR